MTRRFLIVLMMLVFVLALAACGDDDKDKNEDQPTLAASPTLLTYTTLSVQQAHDQLSSSSDALLVDVRNPEEWADTGVPAGATLISLSEFEQRAPGELPKDKEIYVICRSGNRSQVAAEILMSLGYPKVYNIDGGMLAWIQAGLPIEVPTTP